MYIYIHIHTSNNQLEFQEPEMQCLVPMVLSLITKGSKKQVRPPQRLTKAAVRHGRWDIPELNDGLFSGGFSCKRWS